LSFCSQRRISCFCWIPHPTCNKILEEWQWCILSAGKESFNFDNLNGSDFKKKIGIWSIEDITGPFDKFLADDGNVYFLFEYKKKVVDKPVKDKLKYELEIIVSYEEAGPTLVFLVMTDEAAFIIPIAYGETLYKLLERGYIVIGFLSKEDYEKKIKKLIPMGKIFLSDKQKGFVEGFLRMNEIFSDDWVNL